MSDKSGIVTAVSRPYRTPCRYMHFEIEALGIVQPSTWQLAIISCQDPPSWPSTGTRSQQFGLWFAKLLHLADCSVQRKVILQLCLLTNHRMSERDLRSGAIASSDGLHEVLVPRQDSAPASLDLSVWTLILRGIETSSTERENANWSIRNIFDCMKSLTPALRSQTMAGRCYLEDTFLISESHEHRQWRPSGDLGTPILSITAT